MAYDEFNPPSLIGQGVAGGARFFDYSWTDPIADVIAAGYITNAADLGMRVGDSVRYHNISTPDEIDFHLIVSEVNADGTGTFAFPDVPAEAIPVGETIADDDQVLVIQNGRMVRSPLLDLFGDLAFATEAYVDAQVAAAIAFIQGLGYITASTIATLSNKTINAANNAISNLTTAMFAANVIDNDATLAAASATRLATQAAVKTYVDNNVTSDYQGGMDCSADPDYPAADRGHLYRVTVAGKIGGASGVDVDVGDEFVCNTDGTVSGDQATVGAFWDVYVADTAGLVTGPASATAGNPAVYDGVTGKLIKEVTFDAFRTSLGVAGTVADLAALKALVAGDVTVGNTLSLIRTSAGGDPDFYVFDDDAAANGFPTGGDGFCVVENTAGTITFVRKQYIDKNEVDLRWFAPPVDGTSDCATAITAWYTAVNDLAAITGRCRAVVPAIGVGFLTSVPVLMKTGFILCGGGLLQCHSSMAQGLNLLRTNSLTAGLNTYGQAYIELNGIRLSGGNRTLTIGSLQGLVRIYSTDDVVIDNLEAYSQQSHLLVFAGNRRVNIGGNVRLHDWGHPSNGIAITNAVNNGSGLIRLTVSSTSTMTTGDTRIVNEVTGVTAANGTWTVTVINGTTVDLQGSAFAGVFSGSSGKISSGTDGGSAIIAIANPTDETVHGQIDIAPGVNIYTGNWNGMQIMSDFYKIVGVTIRNVKEAGIFARNVNASAPGNFVRVGIISNCIIESVSRAYIDASGIVGGGLKQKISNNYVRDCANIGISIVSEATDVVVNDNHCISCNQDAVAFPSGGGILLRDALSSLSPVRVRIMDNTIYDEAVSVTSKYGVAVFNISPSANALNDVEVTGNKVYRAAAVAGDEIYIDGTSAAGARLQIGNNPGYLGSSYGMLTPMVKGVYAINPGSISANLSLNVDTTVTGAEIGDTVTLGLPANGTANGIVPKAFVVSADTVRINFCNVTTAAVDPSNQNYVITCSR